MVCLSIQISLLFLEKLRRGEVQLGKESTPTRFFFWAKPWRLFLSVRITVVGFSTTKYVGTPLDQ